MPHVQATRQLGGLVIPLAAAGTYALLAVLWLTFWDDYLANAPLLANLVARGSYSSLREWLFIGITSILIFVVLKLTLFRISLPLPATPHDDHGEESGVPVLRVIVVVFVVLTVTISVSGLLSYLGFREKVIDSEKNEILSVTLLKRDQISRWFTEHGRDLEVVTTNPFVTRELHTWVVGAGGLGPAPERAAERLAILQRVHGYRALWLLDAQGKSLISAPEGATAPALSAFGPKLAAAAVKHGTVVTGSHPRPGSETPEIGIAMPLSWRPEGGQAVAFATIYGEIDPKLRLLPLLSTWPVPSDTAEALLVQTNGADVVYLKGDLVRRGRAKVLPPQVRAILAQLRQGEEFLGNEAIGAKGERFIVAAQRISGTPWAVIGTEALDEVVAPLNTLASWSGAVVGVALLVSAILCVLAGRYQHALHVIARQRSRIERDALVKHYDYLAKFANDLIILADERGMIVEANDRALMDSGYSREEALRMNVRDLVPPDARPQFERNLEKLGPAGTIFETAYRRKDGQEVLVEISARTIEIRGKRYLQGILRDITERKQTERELVDSEERFRGLVEQSLTGIYIIQDGKFAYVNPRTAEIAGYDSADQLIGRDPLPMVAEKDRARVEQNMREQIEGKIRSKDYEFTVRRKDGSLIEVGVHSAHASYRGRPAIVGLIQDISEKKRAAEQIRRHVAQVESALMSTVKVATSLGEMRDPYTAGHQRRVAEIAVAIGAELGFDARRQEGLRIAGYLHDVGKITIPAEILSKPGKLSAIEYQLIKGHPRSGYEVLKEVEFPWPVAEVALQHHERMDGGGYPQGLKGEAIVIEARIMAVADVMEAMSSHRPYRPGLGIDAALAEIEGGRGSAYDPAAADACLKLFREKGYAIPG